MAKRFIETDFFKDPFIRGLEGALKGLYVYLFLECSNGGIWNVELDVARLRCGIPNSTTDEDIKTAFGDKIIELDSGQKWFLKNFLNVQHKGELRAKNPAHTNVIPELLKYNLVEEKKEGVFVLKTKPLPSPSEGAIVMVKEKGNGKREGNGNTEVLEKIHDAEIWPTFDDLWEEYDKKTGSKSKLQKKWDKFSQDTKELIMAYIPDYKLAQPDKKFRKNLETFFNNEGWNDEIIISNGVSVKKSNEQIMYDNAEKNIQGWN